MTIRGVRDPGWDGNFSADQDGILGMFGIPKVFEIPGNIQDRESVRDTRVYFLIHQSV